MSICTNSVNVTWPLTLQWSAMSEGNDSRATDHHNISGGCFLDPIRLVLCSCSRAVSRMTLRCVTRRHFPPLLTLSEADTRMGHRHTPLPRSNTSQPAARKAAARLLSQPGHWGNFVSKYPQTHYSCHKWPNLKLQRRQNVMAIETNRGPGVRNIHYRSILSLWKRHYF